VFCNHFKDYCSYSGLLSSWLLSACGAAQEGVFCWVRIEQPAAAQCVPSRKKRDAAGVEKPWTVTVCLDCISRYTCKVRLL